jgi:hypothetical protein
MANDWTAPGKSAFWTKTFHAALTGLLASGTSEHQVLSLARQIANRAVVVLTEAEEARKAEEVATREQRRQELIASFVPGASYRIDHTVYVFDRCENDVLFFDRCSAHVGDVLCGDVEIEPIKIKATG